MEDFIQMSPELYEAWCMSDPRTKDEMDERVRNTLGIPTNRYYSIQTYPDKCAGRVRLTGERIVHVKKISKSDNP